MEELGRALLPGAFLPTVLASAILHAAGAEALNGLVKDMAGGTLTGAVGFAPGIRATPAGRPRTRWWSTATAGRFRRRLADLVILRAALDGEDAGRRWVVVDAADAKITPVDSLDLVRPAGRVRVDHLSVPPAGCSAGCGRAW